MFFPWSFQYSALFIRFKKKRMSHWPEPMSARTGQGEGSSASDWEEDEGRRSATDLGAGAKKDDDISVLLEDSDDEWIPGMLKN